MGSEIPNKIEGSGIADAPGASDGSNKSHLEGERYIEDEEMPSNKANQAASSIQSKDKRFQGLGGWHKWRATSNQVDPPLQHSSDQVLPPKGSLVDPTILPSSGTDKRSSPSLPSTQTPQPITAPIREFQLWVSPSHMNHQAYIERQGYYASFIPNRKTIMAEDLENRVPLAGLIDCRINKEEVPLRLRNKRQEKGLSEPFSIRALWEKRHSRKRFGDCP